MLAKISESLPFAGYKDKKETEKKIFRDVFQKGDSWFNFGDLVLDQGFKHIQFVDRIGDTFRWKGENVSTGEVEKVLNTHGQVSESTAYGVKIPGTDGRGRQARSLGHDADGMSGKRIGIHGRNDTRSFIVCQTTWSPSLDNASTTIRIAGQSFDNHHTSHRRFSQ